MMIISRLIFKDFLVLIFYRYYILEALLHCYCSWAVLNVLIYRFLKIEEQKKTWEKSGAFTAFIATFLAAPIQRVKNKAGKLTREKEKEKPKIDELHTPEI